MLVLSRRVEESIVVMVPASAGMDHKITIKIIEIRGDKVRLGISAPDEVPIHREEVYEAIQQLKKGNST